MNSTQRSNHWSLTINNPTPADYEEMDRARQKGWKVTGQLEKGEQGNLHLQLHLQTPQVRFSAVKKAFARAHIEVARNVQALENYVNKEETREGALPTTQEMYPSLSKFWRLVLKNLLDRNWILNWDPSDGTWNKDAYYDLGYRYEHEGTCEGRRRELREEMALEALEAAVGDLIEQGYHVEHFLSPPNRYAFKKFIWSILTRAKREEDAQTSRQTDMRSDDDESVVSMEHNHAISEVQEVQVPTLQEACLPTSPSDAAP